MIDSPLFGNLLCVVLVEKGYQRGVVARKAKLLTQSRACYIDAAQTLVCNIRYLFGRHFHVDE